MQAFIADSDPDETGRRWKKWKNELITRFPYIRISSTQDRVDALHIYGGEQIRELIESLLRQFKAWFGGVERPPPPQRIYILLKTQIESKFKVP